MTETPDFKKIFNDLSLSEGDHIFEMRNVNLQQLASHLEELYLQNQELWGKIEALETQLKDVQVVVRTHENVRNIGL